MNSEEFRRDIEHFIDLTGFSVEDSCLCYHNKVCYENNDDIEANQGFVDDGGWVDEDTVEASSSSQSDFKLKIVFCEVFSVPTIYFTLKNPSGTLVSCDEIWDNVFKEDSTNFIGKISIEQILSERMMRIHPCHTGSILAGFSLSKNKTHALLSILLRPFFSLDPHLKNHFQ